MRVAKLFHIAEANHAHIKHDIAHREVGWNRHFTKRRNKKKLFFSLFFTALTTAQRSMLNVDAWLVLFLVASNAFAISFRDRFNPLTNQTFIEIGSFAESAASWPGAASAWFGICVEASPFVHELMLASHSRRCIAINMLLARSAGARVAFLDAHGSPFSMPLNLFDMADFHALQEMIYTGIDSDTVERLALSAAPRFPHRVIELETSTLHNVLHHWRVMRDKGRFSVIQFVFLNHIPRQAYDVARGWFDADADGMRVVRFVVGRDVLQLDALRELFIANGYSEIDDIDDALVFEKK